MASYDKHLLDGEHLGHLISKIKALVGTKITNPATKSNGQVLQYNGSSWEAVTLAPGGVESVNVSAGETVVVVDNTDSANPRIGLAVCATPGNVSLTKENDGLKANVADAALTIAKTNGLQSALDAKQGTLTAGVGIDITNDVIREQAPKITIAAAQIVSQNPIIIEFTSEQHAILNDERIIVFELDLTAVGMSKNYWKKAYFTSSGYRFEDYVADNTIGVIDYTSASKRGTYSTSEFQNKLTAGSNISINNNTISVTGLGTAAAKDYVAAVTQDSTALVTSGAVFDAVKDLTGFHFEIVQELPAVGQPNIIYLVLKSSSASGNIYTEYAWINNQWEQLGDTQLTLEYLTNAEIDTIWDAAV